MKNYRCILLISLMFLSYNLFSISFPIYRADEERSGNFYEVAVVSTQPNFWQLNIQGEILSSPVIKNNVLYIGSRDGSIWAVDGKTGNILWQYSTSGMVDSPVFVWKNYVYVISTDGKLYCFKLLYNEEDCVPLWTFDTQNKSYGSSLVINDEKLIFVSGPNINGLPYGYLYILNPTSGELITKVPLGNFSYSSVSYDNENIYFATNDGYIKAYNLKEEKFVWEYKVKSCLNRTTVVPYEDKLYFYAGDTERRIFVLDKYGNLISTSSQLSNFATDNTQITISSSYVFLNIYPTSVWKPNLQQNVVHSSQTVICINKENLQIVWRKDFKVKSSPEDSYGFTSSPILLNNMLYFGLNNGDFYGIDLSSASVVFEFKTGSPILVSPVASNGWIYFANISGAIYGIEAEKFISIIKPDIYDVIVNTQTFSVENKGFEGENYNLTLVSKNEEVLISSGSLPKQLSQNFDFRQFLDGKYQMKMVVSSYLIKNKITIDNSPLPPTNLTATVFENGKVLLSWSKSLDDGEGNNDVLKYNIYRSFDEANYINIGSTQKGICSYIDQINFNTTHYYKITAEDKYSQSEFLGPVKIFVSPKVVLSEFFEIKKDSECIIVYQKDNKKIELEFKKGTLHQDINLLVQIPNEYYKNFPNGVRQTNLIFDITTIPQNIKFTKPIKLRIYYNNEDIVGLNSKKLRIYYFDEKNLTWRMIDTSKSYPEKNYVEADIYHLSLYTLVEYNSLDDKIFKDEYVYVFPSPAKGNELYFKFLLQQEAEIKVYVYDILGDLIWKSELYKYDDLDIGKIHLIKWDIRNIATGMYIFRIEGKNNRKKQNVIKKFAIIH